MYLDFVFHAANQGSAIRARWNQTRNWLSVLCDHDSFRVKIVENGQALFLKFGCIDFLHNGIIVTLDINYVQLENMSSYFRLPTRSSTNLSSASNSSSRFEYGPG